MVTDSQPTGLSRRTLIGAAAAVAAAGVLAMSGPERASAWGGYSNGYIPLSAMTKVNFPGVNYWSWSSRPEDGAVDAVYMEPGAAQSLVALLSAYKAASGQYLVVNEGYRTFAGQVYWANHGSGGTPGQSNHGLGMAFDFDPSVYTRAQHSWVLANAARFNYKVLGSGVFEEFDWMHFNYTGAPGGSPAEHPSTTPAANRPREEDKELAQYYRHGDTGQIGRFGGGVTIFAGLDAYKKHRAVVGLWNSKNPSFTQVVPPDPISASNFISLDAYGWNVQVAAHGGIVG